LQRRRISGSYSYCREAELVEVRATNGVCKVARVGGTTPELLATRMLAELADDGKE